MDKAGELRDKIPLDGSYNPKTGEVKVTFGCQGDLYTDPDATSGTAGGSLPTPGELEARFNRLKHPVNPNDGPGNDPVDTSSPPPERGGLDPTLILVDPDAATGGGSGTPKIDIAPIDHVPGWQPELSGTGHGSPSVGVGGDTVGRHWP